MRRNQKVYLIREIINQKIVRGFIREDDIVDEVLKLNKLSLRMLQTDRDNLCN